MDIYEIIAKNIQAFIEKKGVTLTEVSRESAVPQSRLHKFINRNQERISIDDLLKIAKYFDIPLNGFLEETGLPEYAAVNGKKTDYDFIRFYDVKVSAGHGELVEQEPARLMPVERSFIVRLGYPASELAVLEVTGDSMEPTLRSGDYVIVYTPTQQLCDFMPGIYVIRDLSGLKIKRLNKDKFGNLLVISDNKFYQQESYTPEEEGSMVDIVGRVVSKMTMV